MSETPERIAVLIKDRSWMDDEVTGADGTTYKLHNPKASGYYSIADFDNAFASGNLIILEKYRSPRVWYPALWIKVDE